MNAPGAARGFTLIELMITVAILGILAALAIPAYQDFLIRARVSEGIAFVAPYKSQLVEYISNRGTVPAADIDYFVQAGQTVERVKWSIGRGAIEVWFGSRAGAELAGTILWLMPTIGDGSIRWTCRGHTGAGGAGWRIEPRFLPGSCR